MSIGETSPALRHIDGSGWTSRCRTWRRPVRHRHAVLPSPCPRHRRCRSTPAQAVSSTSLTTTDEPTAPKRSAIAWPMPLPAPVTTTTFPARSDDSHGNLLRTDPVLVNGPQASAAPRCERSDELIRTVPDDHRTASSSVARSIDRDLGRVDHIMAVHSINPEDWPPTTACTGRQRDRHSQGRAELIAYAVSLENDCHY